MTILPDLTSRLLNALLHQVNTYTGLNAPYLRVLLAIHDVRII